MSGYKQGVAIIDFLNNYLQSVYLAHNYAYSLLVLLAAVLTAVSVESVVRLVTTNKN